MRARILKRAGDSIGAVQAMEEARALDLQDRFLNTKAAKYLFRDGQIEEASTVLGLFTKVCPPSGRHASQVLNVCISPNRKTRHQEQIWKTCNPYST